MVEAKRERLVNAIKIVVRKRWGGGSFVLSKAVDQETQPAGGTTRHHSQRLGRPCSCSSSHAPSDLDQYPGQKTGDPVLDRGGVRVMWTNLGKKA